MIASESNLEPSADFQSIIEEYSGEENEKPLQEQEYAFIESMSQNAGVAHE